LRWALDLGKATEGVDVGVVTNERLAAQRRKIARHIERTIRNAERRSPEAARRRARVRAATRSGKAALRARAIAEQRLVVALRQPLDEELSIRAAAEKAGVSYYQARQLIRAAEVGGQV
jgi:hypothetical protein